MALIYLFSGINYDTEPDSEMPQGYVDFHCIACRMLLGDT